MKKHKQTKDDTYCAFCDQQRQVYVQIRDRVSVYADNQLYDQLYSLLYEPLWLNIGLELSEQIYSLRHLP